MNPISKALYKIKRLGNSLFTYDCVSCGKAARSCLCDECKEKLVSVPNYNNGCAFAYYYEGPAKEVMLRYKFDEDYEFCFDSLCDWLTLGFKRFGEEKFDAVIPVPDFETKENRLFMLTKKFAVINDLSFSPNMLKKIRKTEKQHKISPSERRHNLCGAFKASDSVCGKTVLLVDDIFTTGSTAAECASALYDAGAEKVCVLAVLKTRFHD